MSKSSRREVDGGISFLFVVIDTSALIEWEGEGGCEAFVAKGFSSEDFGAVTGREEADK